MNALDARLEWFRGGLDTAASRAYSTSGAADAAGRVATKERIETRMRGQDWLLKAASNDASGCFHSRERTNPTASLAPCRRSMPASSHSIEIGPV